MRLLDDFVSKFCMANRRTYSGTIISCAVLQQMIMNFRSLIQSWQLKELVSLLQHELFHILELAETSDVHTPIDTQRELACCLLWIVVAESWAIGVQASFSNWNFTQLLHSCLASAWLMQGTGLWEEGRYVCELAYSICSRAGVLSSPLYTDEIHALGDFKYLFNESIAIFGNSRIFHVIYGLHVRNHPILGVESWVLVRLDPKAGSKDDSDIPDAAPYGAFIRLVSQVQDMFPDADISFARNVFPVSISGQSVQLFPLFDTSSFEETDIREREENNPIHGDYANFNNSNIETNEENETDKNSLVAMAHQDSNPHIQQKSIGNIPQSLFTVAAIADSEKQMFAHEDAHPGEQRDVAVIRFKVPQKQDVGSYIDHLSEKLTSVKKQP